MQKMARNDRVRSTTEVRKSGSSLLVLHELKALGKKEKNHATQKISQNPEIAALLS